jgi:hypothetical protein
MQAEDYLYRQEVFVATGFLALAGFVGLEQKEVVENQLAPQFLQQSVCWFA